MVAATEPGWLQSVFDTLTVLFERVGLHTNVHKTVGMVCILCRAAGVRADKAFPRRMTELVCSFKERQREQVLCPKCRKQIAKGSLLTHRQTHHGVAKGWLVPESDEADGGDKPQTYRMAFPAKAGPRPCPVEGCSGRASTQTAMRVHFWN